MKIKSLRMLICLSITLVSLQCSKTENTWTQLGKKVLELQERQATIWQETENNYKIAYKSSDWPEMHWQMLLMEHQAVQDSTAAFMLMATVYGRERNSSAKNNKMDEYIKEFLPLHAQRIGFKHEFLFSISSSFQSKDSKSVWEKTIKMDQDILNLMQRIQHTYNPPVVPPPAA